MNQLLQTLALITPVEYVLGIAASLITALLIAVGGLLWRQTAKVQELSLKMDILTKEVERLKRTMEQGRKWRWDKTPLPEPDDD